MNILIFQCDSCEVVFEEEVEARMYAEYAPHKDEDGVVSIPACVTCKAEADEDAWASREYWLWQGLQKNGEVATK